jgi:hypothetical protein
MRGRSEGHAHSYMMLTKRPRMEIKNMSLPLISSGFFSRSMASSTR